MISFGVYNFSSLNYSFFRHNDLKANSIFHPCHDYLWMIPLTERLKNSLVECINYLIENKEEILIKDDIMEILDDELDKNNLVLECDDDICFHIYCSGCDKQIPDDLYWNMLKKKVNMHVMIANKV